MKQLFLILAPLLLASCLYDAVYNLDEHDLAWLPPYEQGDTVLFASGELVDTMVVEKAWLYNDHPIFMENEASSVYNAYGGIFHTLRHNGDSISCSYIVKKRNETETRITMRARYSMFNRQKTNIRLHRAISNDREYDDLFVIDKSNTRTYQPTDTLPFDRIIWSRSQGLVQYIIEGRKYDFLKKL